ncbi:MULTISPECIES: amino acid ABC transporter permease [unclassified Modestobacter]|uniref:amino acid ABC transporter permease n=1 Tax=unclassified Modestobacter TaxID=2643866 RepID=UPI0022AA6CAC|nr:MULTISPECIES: amino acid ABC transporter permease [unclassified Modestobacter]MCZ2826640.1 amino acid ABC transporter permease [Modestobacter sp. VKM Ac-2981]MCZ2855020.1 amino acid ABC transporter permease [Modestobacter sp. VKM Ac-2982]
MSHTGAFLYDAPGPRARRRIMLGSVVSALVLAGLLTLALVQFGRTGQLDADRWTPFLDWPIWSYLLVGLRGTALAAALVAVLAGAFGVLLAIGRLSQNRPLRWLSTGYIEVARTIPVLLLIYLMLFGLPAYGINLPVLWKLVVPLTIANAAVVAEIVRAGVLALPRGQMEAALSLGIRRGQAMRFVVLPQALRHVTPSLVTQLVSLIKDTSLGYVVAFTELLYRAQVLSAYNRLLIQTFLVVALIYLVFNGALSYLAARLRTRVRRQVAPPSGPAEQAADRELETPVVR